MKYFPPKGIVLSKRYFALCEREILGYSILPLFEEYEFIRCLKSTGDTFSVNHCKEWSIDKTISIMCIYDNIREFTTRAGNKMYKLNVFDEYGSTELYVYSKDYYKYCIGLIKHEPIMIQIKIENGFEIDSLCLLFNSEKPVDITSAIQAYNTYTENDCYNVFYNNRISNIYNPNTRFLSGYFNLNYSF